MACSTPTTVAVQVPPYLAPTNLKITWQAATNPDIVGGNVTWSGQPNEQYTVIFNGEAHNTTGTSVGIGVTPGSTTTVTVMGSLNGQSGSASVTSTAPSFVPAPQTKIVIINQDPTLCSGKYGQNVMSFSIANVGGVTVQPGQSADVVLPKGGIYPFSLVSAGGGYPMNSNLVIATGEIQYWYVCQDEYSPSISVQGKPISS